MSWTAMLYRSICALGVAAVLCCGVALADPPAKPRLSRVPDVIVGVYSQLPHHKWVERGINTFVRWEPQNDAQGHPTVSMEQWKHDVAALGCKYICQPSDDPAKDAKDPNLIAFLLEPDEPDDKFIDNDMSGSPQSLLERYQALKKAAPDMPVMINFDLWQMQWHKYDYAAAVKACDWVAGDYYPIIRGDKVEKLSKQLDALSDVADGKRMLAFVECSFQNLDPTYYPGKRGPTPDELQQIVDAVRQHKADVIYFPQSFNPFSYDALSDDIVAKMKQIDREMVKPAGAKGQK